MKNPFGIMLRVKLFLWFMAVGIWSIFVPDFGHKIVRSYVDRLDRDASKKVDKLHS